MITSSEWLRGRLLWISPLHSHCFETPARLISAWNLGLIINILRVNKSNMADSLGF